MALGITNDKYYSDIADAIREINPSIPEETEITPPEMAGYILHGYVDPETHHWVRPDYLPDLNSVYHGEANTLWMTVDATGRVPDPHVSIRIRYAYTVEVGTIQNGVFVPESSENINSNTTWTKVWTPAEGQYPVLKLFVRNSDNMISFEWMGWTSHEGRIFTAQYQPVIEVIGDMYSLSEVPRTTWFTEYEKIMVHGVSAQTALQQRWRNAYNLQEVDISDWDTSEWNITTIATTWTECRSLVVITGIEDLDTSSWTITNMDSTWGQCHSIKRLDLSKWNTSNWIVDHFRNCWSACFNLEYLDISTWDTTNWVVDWLEYTWSNCQSLKELDISSWNTSNWVVQNMTGTWNNCYNLRELDLSKWDTSGWHVQNLNTTWQNCYIMKKLDISTWDVSNWTVTHMNSTWQSLFNLEKLDIGNWNTSNWAVTVMASTWNGCYKLKTLPISDWDVSNWAVTNISGTFYFMRSLEELDLSKWDVSNWIVTNALNPFRYLYNIKKLDIHTWDTSNWPLTDNSGYHQIIGYLTKLTDLDLSCFDLSKFYIHVSSSGSNTFENCFMLQNLTFGQNNNGKLDATSARPTIRFDWSYILTRQSILNIFNALKIGVTGKTLQLGNNNLNRMTAEEKAIATNKGWTLT